MAITFQRVPYVAVDDLVTSTQLRKLAKAWNDRLLSGVGDCAWRLCMWWFNLFRLVRNPSGGLFPSQAEFFDLYQHVEPDMQFTWPIAGPGEEEGANLANPMMQFVFGVADLPSEAARLSEGFPLLLPGATGTLRDYWELGKAQRGAIDADTLAQAWPAGDSSQNLFRISTPSWSPHGKSYGAYFPLPEENVSDCGDWTDTSTASDLPDYIIKFTGLRADVSTAGLHGSISTVDGMPVVTYLGSCPCGTTNHASGHVIGIAYYPFAYYVYVANGGADCAYDIDRLPVKDWLEGPYAGDAVIQRADGQHLQRSTWGFTLDFRGTSLQRGGHGILGMMGLPGAGDDSFDITVEAFPFQEFLTRQYALAPARATQVADELICNYPSVTFNGPLEIAGALGRFADGRTEYDVDSRFVVAGLLVEASQLATPTTIQFCSDGEPFVTITLQPDATGTASTLEWFDAAVVPEPLSIRLPNGAVFNSASGTIVCEVAELWNYKPEAWDAYFVCRMAGTHGGFGSISAGVDGRGIDEDASSELADSLFDFGCLTNRYGVANAREPAEWVNDNPVFDAARRLSRDHMRILRREVLDSHEVASGTTILYFKRFAYGMSNSRIDLFHGIAPPLDPIPSGQLSIGETYLVRGTSTPAYVTYGGQNWNDGDSFTATSAFGLAYAVVGDAQVYVLDGIRKTAPEKGWTNRWCLQLESKVYKQSATSLWKPEAYADFFPWSQRCLFYGGNVPSQTFRRHIALQYGTDLTPEYFPSLLPVRVQATLIAPEAPPGYRYGSGSNLTYADADFCESCQIYEAPYEIDSCTVDDWAEDQIVKVVLSRRLRADPTAPATVARDPATWSAPDKAALAAEVYRTPDNTLREYVLHLSAGTNCSQKKGDCGAGSSLSGLPDNPDGSCYPTFFLCRLVSEPYDDGNDVSEAHDSRCLVDQMLHTEVLTRSCCEGFVDGVQSLELICENPTYAGGLYDYRFENLCEEAFGGRWIGMMSSLDRDDGPAGHGPLPNTIIRAEVYNRLAACVNLLTRARIDLPMEIESNLITYSGSSEVSLGPDDCSESSEVGSWADNVGPGSANTWVSESGWATGAGVTAHWGSGYDGCPFSLVTQRWETEWRLKFVNSDHENAIPDELLTLIQAGGSGVLGTVDYSTTRWDRVEVETSGESWECGAPACHPFFDGSKYMTWTEDTVETSYCSMLSSGTLQAPAPPSGDMFIGRCNSLPIDTFCANGVGSDAAINEASVILPFIEVPLVD